jgi:AcrR family transcriptional regulator
LNNIPLDDNIIILQEPRPTRADALKNRALLLETAQRLFDEQGVDTVSMSAIAEAAGVGKGTLYRHFTDKGELCLALLDKDQRELQERTLTRLREQGDAYANLRWFVGQVLTFIDNHGKWLTNDALQHPAHMWWRQTIRGLFDQLRVSGDRDYKADTLYILLNPHSIEYLRTARGYDRERIEQGLLDTLDALVSQRS